MKLTKEQGLVVTGFTRKLSVSKFSDFHADVEKRLGRDVYTHEMASEEFWEQVNKVYRDDFLAMVPD